MEEFYTAKELARLLKVSEHTIWRYSREGRIPRYKIGNDYRYVLGEVLDALKEETACYTVRRDDTEVVLPVMEDFEAFCGAVKAKRDDVARNVSRYLMNALTKKDSGNDEE